MSTLNELTEVAGRLTKLAARRDELVRQARKEGHPLRTIARAANLSHVGVDKIARKQT